MSIEDWIENYEEFSSSILDAAKEVFATRLSQFPKYIARELEHGNFELFDIDNVRAIFSMRDYSGDWQTASLPTEDILKYIREN